MTVASGDPALTFEYVPICLVRNKNVNDICLQLIINCCKHLLMRRLKEFIKEQLVSIPVPSRAPAPVSPPAQPVSPPTATSDPGDILAGLL